MIDKHWDHECGSWDSDRYPPREVKDLSSKCQDDDEDVGQELHQLKLQLDNARSPNNSEPSSPTESAVATPER